MSGRRRMAAKEAAKKAAEAKKKPAPKKKAAPKKKRITRWAKDEGNS